VHEGDVVEVEKLDGEPGAEVAFERVLCLSGDGQFVPGNPTVPGAVVLGRLEAQTRGRKIIVFRYKSKVNYRRKTGHRQSLSRVRITEIRTGAAPEA
jgi:large subunit ribosomal protein L21